MNRNQVTNVFQKWVRLIMKWRYEIFRDNSKNIGIFFWLITLLWCLLFHNALKNNPNGEWHQNLPVILPHVSSSHDLRLHIMRGFTNQLWVPHSSLLPFCPFNEGLTSVKRAARCWRGRSNPKDTGVGDQQLSPRGHRDAFVLVFLFIWKKKKSKCVILGRKCFPLLRFSTMGEVLPGEEGRWRVNLRPGKPDAN